VEGGAVVSLGIVPNINGATWGEDGSIVVSQIGKGLLRIPTGGGPPEVVGPVENGEIGLPLPQILPGAKAILFAAGTTPDVDKFTIEVLTLADRRRKIVARGGATPRYLPSSIGAPPGGLGHLIYVNHARLFAIPFNLEKLETRGTAVPVLDNLASDTSGGSGQLSFSRTGTLVYRKARGTALRMTTLQWVDATGRHDPLRAKPDAYLSLALSPDGKRVALTVNEGASMDVWICDPQRDAITRLTFGGMFYDYPAWSPDGQYVVFSRIGGGIFQVRADGAGELQALTESKTTQLPWSFTPDGERLAYVEVAGNNQIWTVPLGEHGGKLKAGKPEQFLKSSFADEAPSFSPDGRWLAYHSNESGKNEVYVRGFPPASSGQGGKWQISNSGGTTPHWSRNGL
jgi:eukaryotic-like serine/threonine-protein kinase